MLRAYQQLKNVYHFFQAHAWRMWYGMPDQGLKLYGVTGTNGKTTTSILLASMLQEEFGKEKVGLLTTIVFWIGGKEIVNETKMTTMKSRNMFRYLREMKRAGVTCVVLEVTSHALDQHRLAGIKLDGAVIMNIQREHLDYHQTMEEYMRAKEKIADYIGPKQPLVLKADDEWVAKIIQELRMNHRPQAGSRPRRENYELSIIEFTAAEAQSVQTPLIGETNKENVLAATKLAKAVGVSEDAIRRAVAKVDHVPGRMEWVNDEIQNPSASWRTKIQNLPRVLIDYAVTPDALERLYDYVRGAVRSSTSSERPEGFEGRQAQGKIYGILGAAGLRDRGKRADMARAVAQRADELILTREDPWTEDEEQIFRDLEKGLTGKTNWRRIVDRREAIHYCLQKAQVGDVVVVTGKGAETGMGVGKKIVPWSDRKVILEELKALGEKTL